MSLRLNLARSMDQQVREVADQAGSPATVRTYLSGTAGTPWAGTQETRTYIDRPIRLLALHPATINEINAAGGRIQGGDQVAFLLDVVGVRDRVLVRGQEWSVASVPEPAVLNGTRGHTVILRRQGT